MSNRRVRWLRLALRDMDAIMEHIAKDDAATAHEVASRILQACNTLSHSSERGRAGRVPGTRELVMVALPYIVAYRVVRDEVHILRVLHHRMQRSS
ncbi:MULTISPECIES: type II toxin-antitoxin system RelE/ParE family toxin [Nitratidesulfovibrio]|uniref:Plasmid stabilization system family protein n=1 Tax=Nitratidesulfovibrio vulgaris (strain ATCC 29579 / DSM 644 / CCUG 34227 / NCIMB 8303 / VKM B-1760 / Hildenborough) TaxID=882 RepID=Q72AG0_NITV2|nr:MULTISPECIES: type II toxin-antitoxin system RelE/ParE family toxin [Nitratidesulfovibrio]GEB80397.1 plasmid stabilization protein [Desulfovibrio desulfuricans]AAS96510.1 plasmid stabilization system family protein [Nitratidesulfovibrio vulgaris str. Hildenborough]ADP87043.1 plasmid stabilization system [Nitratidesulfovibrio vulgaris RCH1]NHZ48127.1 type II toxin-antitoxin system RelE/ParE family toxin [Nitratidesulfovibrio liaohensis]WCB45567.1 type II toxin-antitoxin system RelE/ParE fami